MPELRSGRTLPEPVGAAGPSGTAAGAAGAAADGATALRAAEEEVARAAQVPLPVDEICHLQCLLSLVRRRFSPQSATG